VKANYMPTSLPEALGLMAEEELIPYAGGTDLMVSEAPGRDFLFLERIPELTQISQDDQYLHIGAAVTFRNILASDLTPALLREAAASIAAPAIRNTATLGGNIANASPKGDGALICWAADAQLVLAAASGQRTVDIADFYQGRGTTIRRADELLVEILLPKRWLAGASFCKVGARKALAISRVSFAGLFAAESGQIAHLAVALGAVADTVVRRPKIDAMLIGKTFSEAKAALPDYLQAWQAAIQPIRGRVSAEYRKLVCLNLIEDFLVERLSSAHNG